MNLTYGEQIRAILKKRHMSIESMAREIEEKTGMKMSRQNLTQRLKRDNFQEKDMRLFAEVLGCHVNLLVLEDGQELPDENVSVHKAITEEMTIEEVAKASGTKLPPTKTIIKTEYKKGRAEIEAERAAAEYSGEEDDMEDIAEDNATLAEKMAEASNNEESDFESVEDMQDFDVNHQQEIHPDEETIDLYDVEPLTAEELEEIEQEMGLWDDPKSPLDSIVRREPDRLKEGQVLGAVPDTVLSSAAEGKDPEIDPATGEEYESNVVRSHPHLVGYVQVYERSKHRWFDMTEWAFIGFQERKKMLLGNDYREPKYLD